MDIDQRKARYIEGQCEMNCLEVWYGIVEILEDCIALAKQGCSET